MTHRKPAQYRALAARVRPLLACAACVAAAQGLTDGAHAAATFYGATPYLSAADSPFAGQSFSQFYLETFEDGKLDVPGVTILNNQPGGAPMGVLGPGPAEDSVDADDGVIDGLGQGGHSYGNTANQANGSFGITIQFDAQALGGLPTHAGLVWTDGSSTALTVFEAFDANGVSLGTIGPVKVGDNSFFGTTAEDRFFGVSNAGGISRLVIRDPGSVNSMEIDHLQYGIAGGGATVPEPASWALVAAGGLLLGTRRRRQGAAARRESRTPR